MTTPSLKTLSVKGNNHFDQEDWSSSYANVDKEFESIELTKIKGEIPKGLSGTLFRNGPGRMERNGQWIHHPFDGDGMITAISFSNGEVSFSNKFVETQAWKEEEKAGKFLYRGVFGTQKPGGILANIFNTRLKNIANTNVIKLGDELLALWEAANPYALDPLTLETIGISTLNGLLKTSESFSAHPRFDPGHHTYPKLVTFGVKPGPISTIRLMEFSTEGEDKGKLISERNDKFKGFAFLHDFAITPNWAIFLQNAISFNPIPFLLGRKSAAQCLSTDTNNTSKFWLIPRESGKFAKQNPRIIDAQEGFVFHHLNSWEDNEDIIIESIYYDHFPSIDKDEDFRQINFDLIPEGRLKRSRINLADKSSKTDLISEQCCEFAMVNPMKQGLSARFSWMAVAENKRGNGPLQAIKKLDLLNGNCCFWSAAPRGFVSEPMMVPEPNSNLEDKGWILVVIWNGLRRGSDLVILNATNLEEVATLELPIGIPHGLHGSWVKGT